MVIGVQPRFLKPKRLLFRQHAQRHASFKPQSAHAAHHFQHTVKSASIRRLPPRRPHAETGRAAVLRAFGAFQNRGDIHQGFFFQLGLVMDRLRTIFAIFGAAACFNRLQGT